MQVYVIECSFILVKFIETRKTGWSHNLGSILHCYVLLTYNSATAGPNFVIGLYFYDFGRFDHNKRTFYNVNLHIWAQNLDKMYDEIRNQILGYNKR